MRSLLLLLTTACLALPAHAESFTLIGTMSPGASSQDAARVASKLAGRPGVLAVAPVFSASEQEALRAMGARALAASLKIELSSRKGAEALRASANGLPVRFEENSLALTTAANPTLEPLEGEQWGLINTGKPQGIYLDNISTLYIPGVAGEDIGISRLPESARAPLRKVIVAVLDTGVDYQHPELAPVLDRKESECQALDEYKSCLKTNSRDACDARYARVDTDGNGYPMDCIGWNLTAPENPVTEVLGDPDADDRIGHGTHVAGIIAAALDGQGTRGVADNVSILPVKVIRSAPNQPIRPQSEGDELPSPSEGQLRWSRGFADVLARGMLYAMRSGAQVINMSLAWPSGVDSELMRQMVKLAESRGVIVVAAAGNDSTDSRVMPCSYPGVICVASHGPDGAFSHFSNYGSFVDIAAPGTHILSTWPMDKRAAYFTERDGYELKNGTSMSTPFVAGIAARMLGMGYSPEEIYARLIAGARPIRPSRFRGPELPEKYIRSGNVDLARAIEVQPEAVILPATKSVLKLAWNRSARRLPLRFVLKNFWADAPLVEIAARLVPNDARPDPADAPGVRLESSHWTLENWKGGSERSFESALVLSSDEVEGKLLLEIAARTGTGQDRVFRIPVEIAVEVTPSFSDPEARVLPIHFENGVGSVSPRASLRTIKNLVPGEAQDYLAIEHRGPDLYLSLLADQGVQYSAGDAVKLAVAGDLLQSEKLDVDGDGVPEIVLLLRSPDPAGSPKPIFRFVICDLGLHVLRTIDYDNQPAAVSERFEWLKLQGKMTPAWVGFGLTPKLDQPAYDPWNPDWKDTPTFRFYYLSDQGVRMLSAPGDYFFVQLLSQTDEQRRKGLLPVLLARGDDYVKKYAVALVSDGKLTELTPLTLKGYQMLLGISDLGDLTPLDGSARSAGTSFTTASSQGARRISVLVQGEGVAPNASHFSSRPPVITDSVMGLYAAYSTGSKDPAAVAAFSETHYDLLYQDLTSGETATTTLGRFSYIPAFIFGKSFFPVVAERRLAHSRIPAILAPADIGESDGLEIIVPSYGTDGKLLGLSRPARLRLEAASGCEALGNPIEASPSAPSQAVFFCGDRLIRIPFTD